MSTERLARLDRHFQRYIDDGRLTGWQLSVARHGKVVHHSIAGQRDVAADRPVEADTIWRIFSMTKPVTAVLALQLWEEGLFELNDPVHRYIPAFRDTKVWRAGSVNAPVLEPITETMRLWQLFAHTSGLTYGFMYNHPVDELYRRAGFEWGSPAGCDLEGVCDVLAALPLLFQPGSEWSYSMGLDVLGRVLEVVGGQPLDELMRTRLLEPLGMHETTWHVPEANHSRLATLYGAHPTTRQAVLLEPMGQLAKQPPAFLGGGGGLQSTAYDYHRFTQMLVNGGELDGAHPVATHRQVHGQQPPARQRRPHGLRPTTVQRDRVRRRRLRARRQRQHRPGERSRARQCGRVRGVVQPAPRSGWTRSTIWSCSSSHSCCPAASTRSAAS